MEMRQYSIAALMIVAAFAAQAQEKKDSISIAGNLSSQSFNGFRSNSGQVFVSYGRLVTSSIELEGRLTEFLSSSNGTNSNTTTIGAGIKYYFGAVGRGGAVVPYLRAGADRSTTSGGGGSLTAVSGGGGIEMAMTESAAAFVEAAYQHLSGSSISGNGYGVNVGLKVRF